MTSIQLFESSDLTVTCEAGLAVLLLRREKALNALSSSYLSDLKAAWRKIEGNRDVRAVVLLSSHPKAFIAGADIAEMRGKDRPGMTAYSQHGHEFMSMLESSRLVVIAAINGYCLGGGFEVALSCDLIVAGPRAQFAFPEIGLGLLPGFGGTQRFTRSAGMHAGLKYMLSGDRFGRDEAVNLGLVWRSIDGAEEFNEAAKSEAKKIALQAPAAMAAIKQLTRLATHVDLANGCTQERDEFGSVGAQSDAQEGLAAFLEKRPPVFSGQ